MTEWIPVVQAAFTLIGLVFTGWMTYLMAKLHKGQQEVATAAVIIAEKVETVATKADTLAAKTELANVRAELAVHKATLAQEKIGSVLEQDNRHNKH